MDSYDRAAERHQRLLDLFQLAAEADEAERSALLDEACAEDPELRRELELLLDADSADTGLLARPAFAAAGPGTLECPRCLACFDAGITDCPADGATLVPGFQGTLLVDDRYRIARRLGSGGMGGVYDALHLGLDKHFALKLIQSGPILSQDARNRFGREGRALGRLQHPHIVSVTDAGTDASGRPYLVMELLRGVTLHALLQREGSLPPERALSILRAVGEAIDFAHSQHVTHGDIKPGNIILTETGDIKVLDFGLAELLDTRSAQGPVMGTPAYMTAAVLRGAPADQAADHHALAVLAYELLTGDVPYGRTPAEVLARQEMPAIKPSCANPSLPAELDAAATAGLERRFESAVALVALLERAFHKVLVREWRRREIPLRCLLAVGIATLLLAPAAWLGTTDLVRSLENRTVDFRFGLRPDRPPDPRLLLVSIDDATLAASSTPLAARADEAAERLDGIFGGDPQAVAVDLLLPVQWSRSSAFQGVILRHAGKLRLGLLSGSNGETTGTECLSLMTAGVLGPDDAGRLFAFVNLEPSADGIVRHAREGYRDRNAGWRPTLAAALADSAADRTFYLDSSIRWQDIERVSWKDLDRDKPERYRGRLVLVGAEFQGSGDTDLPAPARAGRPKEITGLALQALAAATILEGSPIHDLPAGPSAIRRWFLFALPAALLLCARRAVQGGIAAAALVLVSVAIDLTIFRYRAVLNPMAAEYAVVALTLLPAMLVRTRRPGFPAATDA